MEKLEIEIKMRWSSNDVLCFVGFDIYVRRGTSCTYVFPLETLRPETGLLDHN